MVRESYDVVVVGAGLGGLTAALQLARQGHQVLLLERQANLGGAATRYRHAGMTIEASLHDVDGHTVLADGGLFHHLGIRETSHPVPLEDFYRVESGPVPHPVTIPKGLTAAGLSLLEAFPDASASIHHWIEHVRGLVATLDTMEGLSGRRWTNESWRVLLGGQWIGLLRHLRATLQERLDAVFGDHEALKCAVGAVLPYFDDDPTAMSHVLYAGIWGRYVEHGGYFFDAGGQSVTMALAGGLHRQGVDILREAEVNGILTDARGAVSGVRFAHDGSVKEVRAPVVVANASPYHLVDWLSEDEAAPLRKRLSEASPSISLFTMVFGLAVPPSQLGIDRYMSVHYPADMTRFADYALHAARFADAPGRHLPPFLLTDHSRFQAVPEGGLYPVTVAGVDRFDWWRDLSEEAELQRRDAWLRRMSEALERRYPGFGGAVKHHEMANARTLRNRLNTPQGEVYGFRPTPARMFGGPPLVTTGVPGLYCGSAYTVSGGYAGAMHGGQMAAMAAHRQLSD